MRPITVPGIEEYATTNSSPDPQLVLNVSGETRDCFAVHEMMIGPLVARFLQMLLYALRAKRVLEIGTFTGYSAISMAAASHCKAVEAAHPFRHSIANVFGLIAALKAHFVRHPKLAVLAVISSLRGQGIDSTASRRRAGCNRLHAGPPTP